MTPRIGPVSKELNGDEIVEKINDPATTETVDMNLDELNDSDIISPTDGETLRWDSGINKWVNSVLGCCLSWQQSVLDKDLTAPPGGPSSGDRYIIALSPTGAWSGHEDDIAEWDGAQWNFTEHVPGMAAWVEDEDDIYVCIGDHVAGVRCWDKLEVTINHAALENLTYGSSGHTGFLQDTTDIIKNTHIDWGTGANQVSADDIPDGSTNAIITLAQEINFTTAYNHTLLTNNPHAVTYAQAGAIQDAANTVFDTHINWGAGANQVDCSDLPIKILGSPTYTNLCNQTDTTLSVGKTSGGGITDNGNQTLTVAAGTGFIKTTDSEIGTIVSFDWAENAAVAYTVDSINYIIVQYNGGVPLVTSTTDFNSINFHDEFVMGYVYGKSATVVDILLAGNNLPNAKVKDCIRLFYRGPERMSGGTIGETGTRQVTCTAGLFYLGDCKIETAQFDSSATNFEHYYYRDSSTTWAEVATTGTIDNIQYNPLTGGSAYSLQDLTPNRYGVHWIYMCFSGEMNVIIGNGNYTLALANAAQPPASIPDYLAKYAILVGKIIIKKSASSFTSIESAFVTQFTSSAVNNHNDLSNIQGGTTDEYYHLTAAQHGNVGSMPAPNYDSGWTPINANELKTFTHSLGGDADKYMVVVDAKSDTWKINQINYGTRQLAGGVAGYRWEGLDTTEIKVWRLPQDVSAVEVRVRIWVHV